MFSLQFDTTKTPPNDIAAILRRLADKIATGSVFYDEQRPITDGKGNRIGTWKLEQ